MTIYNLTIDGVTTPLDDSVDTIIQLGDEWIIGVDHLDWALTQWAGLGSAAVPRGILYLESDNPDFVIAFALDNSAKVEIETISADVVSGYEHPLYHLDHLTLPWSIEVAS